MNKCRWIISSIIVWWSACTYDHFNEISSLCAGTSLSMAISVVNASKCGASDGVITISAVGGAKNYHFSIDGGEFLADTIYTNLKAGTYTVVVKDANGCTASQIASVNNATSTLQFSVTAIANSGCPTPNGSITIAVLGEQGALQYQLNTGSFQQSNTFTGLASGTYTITVADQSNCPVSGPVTIAAAPATSSSVSFQTDISPIIAGNCATSGCHNGTRRPTLNSYSTISGNASSIIGAVNSNMPPGGRLSTQQIALITCWVNAGAPNN